MRAGWAKRRQERMDRREKAPRRRGRQSTESRRSRRRESAAERQRGEGLPPPPPDQESAEHPGPGDSTAPPPQVLFAKPEPRTAGQIVADQPGETTWRPPRPRTPPPTAHQWETELRGLVSQVLQAQVHTVLLGLREDMAVADAAVKLQTTLSTTTTTEHTDRHRRQNTELKTELFRVKKELYRMHSHVQATRKKMRQQHHALYEYKRELRFVRYVTGFDRVPQKRLTEAEQGQNPLTAIQASITLIRYTHYASVMNTRQHTSRMLRDWKDNYKLYEQTAIQKMDAWRAERANYWKEYTFGHSYSRRVAREIRDFKRRLNTLAVPEYWGSDSEDEYITEIRRELQWLEESEGPTWMGQME